MAAGDLYTHTHKSWSENEIFEILHIQWWSEFQISGTFLRFNNLFSIFFWLSISFSFIFLPLLLMLFLFVLNQYMYSSVWIVVYVEKKLAFITFGRKFSLVVLRLLLIFTLAFIFCACCNFCAIITNKYHKNNNPKQEY